MPSPGSEQTSAQFNLNKQSEEERLRKDVYRSDMEKFRLFTKMLRTNAMLKRAKITHKP